MANKKHTRKLIPIGLKECRRFSVRIVDVDSKEYESFTIADTNNKYTAKGIGKIFIKSL